MKKRVLIIDDKIRHLKGAKEQFNSDDRYELITANCFSEAKKHIVRSNIDIIMTDIMMPGEKDGQGNEGENFVGKLMPIGLVIILLALKEEIEDIYIVSDEGHHDHPILWALDSIRKSETEWERVKWGYDAYLDENNKWIKDWKEILTGEKESCEDE